MTEKIEYAYQVLLGKQLIPTCAEGPFAKALSDVYDPPDEVVPSAPIRFGDRTLHPIGSTHFVLETPAGWSFFESAQETAWRVHCAAWADFARGYWRSGPPTAPGTYPVRNRAGHRSRDHVVIQVGEQLKDVDSGFLSPGKVTNWVGSWWSVPYPPLPGAV